MWVLKVVGWRFLEFLIWETFEFVEEFGSLLGFCVYLLFLQGFWDCVLFLNSKSRVFLSFSRVVNFVLFFKSKV